MKHKGRMVSPESADIYSKDFVSRLFDSMSATYGLTNYISSFGFTERWRHRCIEELPSTSGLNTGYDLMTGMGEVWPSLDQRFENAEIIALDISSRMLTQAAKSVLKYDFKISLQQADVLNNGIPDCSADFVVSPLA